MNTEFEILFNYVINLKNRYANLLSSYKIFETINNLTVNNIVGKNIAEKNVKTFNDFRYFFRITKESCRCYFLVEIAKFFDPDTRSLTLNIVLSYAQNNIEYLTKKDFLKYHKEREILPELFNEYKELNLADIKNLNDKIEEKSKIIGNLIKYRNKYLAHDDVEKPIISLTYDEIQQLLTLIKDFITLFYLKLDFANNSFENFIQEPEKELKRLIKYLQNYENNKIKTII